MSPSARSLLLGGRGRVAQGGRRCGAAACVLRRLTPAPRHPRPAADIAEGSFNDDNFKEVGCWRGSGCMAHVGAERGGSGCAPAFGLHSVARRPAHPPPHHVLQVWEVLRKRMVEGTGPKWRQTYKSLLVIEFLVKQSSQRVVQVVLENVGVIQVRRGPGACVLCRV